VAEVIMQVFHCDHCNQLVFFENVHCVKCGRTLAYLPDLGMIGSLDQGADGLWRSPVPEAQGKTYRLCTNYSLQNICNWSVSVDDDHELCLSCRLTRVIPDLAVPGQKDAWFKLEQAKRRLVYALLKLELPLQNKLEDPVKGLAFEFLADSPPKDEKQKVVLTGHADAVITINVAEADDVEREKRRLAMHEPYRTIIGHFRHESGHYYWDRLIRESDWLPRFREQFGDERADYAAALQQHYALGPKSDWPSNNVTAYASVHPWEDWAETWAHYLHMVDSVETAATCGLALRPERDNEPSLTVSESSLKRFDHMLDGWYALGYVLNNLNRGLGLPDAYPFVYSNTVVNKLRFVHDVITGASHRRRPGGWFSFLDLQSIRTPLRSASVRN
jgi:hypothetical protein